MKVKYRLLFFNRYLLLVTVITIFLPFLVWLISSEFLSALFVWNISSTGLTRWEYIQMMY